MTKPYPCIESTIEFVAGGELYRLWIHKDEVQFEYPEDREYVEKIQAYRNAGNGTKEAIEFISKLPNVNAVQIKDKGFPEEGICVYFVEF